MKFVDIYEFKDLLIVYPHFGCPGGNWKTNVHTNPMSLLIVNCTTSDLSSCLFLPMVCPYIQLIPSVKSSSQDQFTAKQNIICNKVLRQFFILAEQEWNWGGRGRKRRDTLAEVAGWRAARAGEGARWRRTGDSQVSLEGVRGMGDWLGGVVGGPQGLVIEIVGATGDW